MKRGKSLALVSFGLIAGLVLGSVGFAYAAPTDTTPANPVLASGLRMGQSIRDAGGRLVDVVAKLTGLSVEDVQAQRADGKSAADIAQANGVDADAVVSEALAIRKAALDARVADGTITQEQADVAYAQMSDRVAERVTTDETGAPSWAGGGRGSGGGGMGGRGAACGTCEAVPVQ
ncbi:MAG: hypothetical protein CVT66_10155 [Actinobacteria bacterium HGW-Actinobacteria-6]|jgi:hypothetical protein|nr:MAG: hypothetical protein CVT66_10155 [Actinobacteria bacterium HGW-Actinobacteria-6]